MELCNLPRGRQAAGTARTKCVGCCTAVRLQRVGLQRRKQQTEEPAWRMVVRSEVVELATEGAGSTGS